MGHDDDDGNAIGNRNTGNVSNNYSSNHTETAAMVGVKISKQASIELVSGDHDDDDLEEMYDNQHNTNVHLQSSSSDKLAKGEKPMRDMLHDQDQTVEGEIEVAIEGVNARNQLQGTDGTRNFVDAGDFNGINYEAFVNDWTANQVTDWVKQKLIEGKIDPKLIEMFLIEWNKQYVTGKVLNICRNDIASLQDIKHHIESSGKVVGLARIWTIVRYEIQNM